MSTLWCVLLWACASLAGAFSGRVAVFIHGESFRTRSHQRSREVGGPGSYEQQKEASMSQLVFLIQPLVFDGGATAVDVHIRTYTTSFDGDLVRWFAPTSFAAAPVGTVDGGVLETLVRLAAANSTYDAVLLIRPDLVLKPLFTRTFLAADLGRLVFPFEVGPEMMPGCPGDLCPRVSDMLVWLPRSAFGLPLPTAQSTRMKKKLRATPTA